MNSIHFINVKVFSHKMVDSTVRKKTSKVCSTYKVYSDKDRFSIGKNVSNCGTASTVRRWEKINLYINEARVCGFKKRYEAQTKDEISKKKSQKTVIVNKFWGRPCLLENKIEPLVQKYLKETRYKEGVMNTMVAIATAKALTKRYSFLEKDHLQSGKSWAQSLFHHLGFVTCMKTTGRVKIPVGA